MAECAFWNRLFPGCCETRGRHNPCRDGEGHDKFFCHLYWRARAEAVEKRAVDLERVGRMLIARLREIRAGVEEALAAAHALDPDKEP